MKVRAKLYKKYVFGQEKICFTVRIRVAELPKTRPKTGQSLLQCGSSPRDPVKALKAWPLSEANEAEAGAMVLALRGEEDCERGEGESETRSSRSEAFSCSHPQNTWTLHEAGASGPQSNDVGQGIC